MVINSVFFFVVTLKSISFFSNRQIKVSLNPVIYMQYIHYFTTVCPHWVSENSWSPRSYILSKGFLCAKKCVLLNWKKWRRHRFFSGLVAALTDLTLHLVRIRYAFNDRLGNFKKIWEQTIIYWKQDVEQPR